jgi:hypothetical protein
MFDRALEVGSSLTFYLKTVNLLPDSQVSLDNTHVSILSAKRDRVLHISLRRAENEICFNAREAEGEWGAEEHLPLSDLFWRTDATIRVHVDKSVFSVSIDGAIVYLFTKRINMDVKGVLYNCKSTSAFVDPIDLIVAAPEVPVTMRIVRRNLELAAGPDPVLAAGFWSAAPQGDHHI